MTSFCTRHSSRPIKRPLESEVSRVRRDKNPLARAAVGCYTLKFKHFCSFLLRVSPSTRYQRMCSGRVWLKPFLAPKRHFVRFYRKRFQKPHEKVWGVSLKGVWWLHVLVIYLGWSTAFTEWEYLCNLGGFFLLFFFAKHSVHFQAAWFINWNLDLTFAAEPHWTLCLPDLPRAVNPVFDIFPRLFYEKKTAGLYFQVELLRLYDVNGR